MKTLFLGLMMVMPTFLQTNTIKVYFDHAEISKGEEVELYAGDKVPIELTGVKPESNVSMKFTKAMLPIKKFSYKADKNGKVVDVFIVPKYELEKGNAIIEFQLANDSKQVFEFKITIAEERKTD